MYSEIQRKMEQIVTETAKIIPDSFDNAEIFDKTGKANYATEYDLKVQKALYKALRELVPEATMVGEEDIGEENRMGEKVFIIDPIDGTMNFARNMRMSTISVAYGEHGDIKAGVVYNPYSKEMFSAAKGKGATLNGKKITVSKKVLNEAIIFVGAAPYYEEMISKTFKIAERFLRVGHDIRRFGSAAYDMCCVACGRGEVMFEVVLNPWDYAAAKLIIEEAGGRVTDMRGEELSIEKKCSVLAANKKAYDEAIKMVSDIL